MSACGGADFAGRGGARRLAINAQYLTAKGYEVPCAENFHVVQVLDRTGHGARVDGLLHGGGIRQQTAALYADFSCGNENAAPEDIQKYDMDYEGTFTPELLADGLSALTGLDFFIESTPAEDGFSIEWRRKALYLAFVYNGTVQHDDQECYSIDLCLGGDPMIRYLVGVYGDIYAYLDESGEYSRSYTGTRAR